MRLLSSCVVAATFVVIASASARDNTTPKAATGAADPPAPAQPVRVGRVSLAARKVAFRGLGETLWSAAEINDPVSTGAALRTDLQSRAEMRIGPDTIDLAEGTEIAIAQLNDKAAEIAVERGRIDLDIRQIGAGETIQIDFARGGVWLLRPGRYDVDAGGGDQMPRVAAFTGGARFVGEGLDLPIDAGDALVLTGSGAAVATTEPAAADDFANWCGARAVDETRLAAPYYVPRSMTGYAELDDAGLWRATAKYGEVWAPKSLPADWAPYRYGHWHWVAPWGWTWVDDQPWGFAPSHYGRWAFVDRHWAWAPGRFAASAVYAPAVVAFLGTLGVGLSFAEGSGPAVAWFPLAPGEVYWPSYTNDLDYIRRLNLADIADARVIRLRADGEPPLEIADAHFANRQFASVVPRPVFAAGQAVAPALLQLPQERLQNAPAIMGSPQIGPPAPPEPVRVAAASTAHEPVPAAHAAARESKAAAWAGIINAAAIRARNYLRATVFRTAHLRAAVYAAAPGLRHTIVLRVARAGHFPASGEARKRVIRR